jgi:hypothetical protein
VANEIFNGGNGLKQRCHKIDILVAILSAGKRKVLKISFFLSLLFLGLAQKLSSPLFHLTQFYVLGVK